MSVSATSLPPDRSEMHRLQIALSALLCGPFEPLMLCFGNYVVPKWSVVGEVRADAEYGGRLFEFINDYLTDLEVLVLYDRDAHRSCGAPQK
jgi:hypothetical protein